EMKQLLHEGSANRLILAACNPLVYQPRLKELEEETGILQSLMEVVNLRNLLNSGVNPTDVTKAAIHELEMSINRLLNQTIDIAESTPVTQKALIVGAGPSGLAAAASLSARQIDVTLVEKANKIGGNLVNIQDSEIKDDIRKLVRDVENHPRVTLHLESEVVKSFGTPGRFVSRIRHQSGEEEPVMHGAT
ncbi:MAG: NAD(P)-binding protein, partial [bacterium]|nr:NAD(P)-binding protein [bacterium]